MNASIEQAVVALSVVWRGVRLRGRTLTAEGRKGTLTIEGALVILRYERTDEQAVGVATFGSGRWSFSEASIRRGPSNCRRGCKTTRNGWW